ncbi:MAG: hypothetical protein WC671_01825 [Candidatus Paceibacterota bacterium]|jgi:hypothetical protein
MKKILIYIAIIVLILVVIFVFLFKNKKSEIIQNDLTPEPIAMCYQYSKDTASGLIDRAWLKMSILSDKVTGEYQNLPAEKDSKIGKFNGMVGKMDPKISGRIADVWWDSFAEGMNVTEQLKIEFGEGSAVAFFGEMVDRGDGVYLYKDETKLTTGFQMSQIDCEVLNDKVINDKVKINLPDRPKTKEPVACTADAKQCPDGSYVGRTGPNCEFVCP